MKHTTLALALASPFAHANVSDSILSKIFVGNDISVTRVKDTYDGQYNNWVIGQFNVINNAAITTQFGNDVLALGGKVTIDNWYFAGEYATWSDSSFVRTYLPDDGHTISEDMHKTERSYTYDFSFGYQHQLSEDLAVFGQYGYLNHQAEGTGYTNSGGNFNARDWYEQERRHFISAGVLRTIEKFHISATVGVDYVDAPIWPDYLDKRPYMNYDLQVAYMIDENMYLKALYHYDDANDDMQNRRGDTYSFTLGYTF